MSIEDSSEDCRISGKLIGRHIFYFENMNHFLFTKSIKQHPNVKAQTSDEIQPLKIYVNNIVDFDDILASKQASSFDMLLAIHRRNERDIQFISENYFHLLKKTTKKFSWK